MATKSEARRASLLDALRSADAPVSGGQLASTLNVSRQIIVQDIALLREAGATEIHMRVSAPPFVSPCYYGTDIDSKENLIACHHTVEETAAMIGADTLGYLSVENVRQIACGDGCDGYCTACFDGSYPTEIPQHTEKSRFEEKLQKGNSDKEKQ